MSLNDKQKLFCKEYLVDLNATKAALRAGYSKNTAYSTGSENLKKPEIMEYIKKLMDKRCKRVEYTQDDLLKDLIEVKNRCMQAVPVKNMRGNQVIDENGNNVWKFDANGANKALDSIAKHIGFYEKDNNQKQTPANLIQKIFVTQEEVDEVDKHIDDVINNG